MRAKGVAVDSVGNVFVADTLNRTVRKITPAGAVTTLAGLPGDWGGADGVGSAAQFFSPAGIAVDRYDNVYVADRFNSTVRKITPAGEVTTLAGVLGSQSSADGAGPAALFYFPQGIAVDSSGTIYVADTGNGTIRKGVYFGPELQIALAAGQLILCWPASAPGFVLEATANLAGATNWAAISSPPRAVNGTNYVTNAISIGNSFYRLRAQ